MNPRARKSQIRARRKRRDDRKKRPGLSESERNELSFFKRTGQFADAVFGRGTADRDIALVNYFHGKNFPDEIITLSKKFPHEEIIGIDEGAGMSSFSDDLKNTLARVGFTRLKMFKTDINPDAKPDMRISPEELLSHFRRGSVHFVVTTFGGVNHTVGSQLKAVANILEILKPGGMASIVTGNTENLRGGKMLRLADLKKAFKSYPNVRAREEYMEVPYLGKWNRITIYKSK